MKYQLNKSPLIEEVITFTEEASEQTKSLNSKKDYLWDLKN